MEKMLKLLTRTLPVRCTGVMISMLQVNRVQSKSPKILIMKQNSWMDRSASTKGVSSLKFAIYYA